MTTQATFITVQHYPNTLTKHSQLPASQYYQLSSRANIYYDIFKKIIDFTVHSLSTNRYYLKRMRPYLPLVGMLFALVGLTMQMSLLLLDGKASNQQKRRALGGFILLFSMTVLSYLLMSINPVFSMGLGLSLLIINFSYDSYNYANLLLTKRQLAHCQDPKVRAQKQQKAIVSPNYRKTLLQREETMQQLTRLLYTYQVSENRSALLKPSIQKTLRTLLYLDRKLKQLEHRDSQLTHQQQCIHSQLPFAHIAMLINIISTTLVVANVAIQFLNPALFITVIVLAACCDLTELFKNIAAYKSQKKSLEKQLSKNDKHCDELVEEAVTKINTKQSYAQVLAELASAQPVIEPHSPAPAKKIEIFSSPLLTEVPKPPTPLTGTNDGHAVSLLQ